MASALKIDARRLMTLNFGLFEIIRIELVICIGFLKGRTANDPDFSTY